MPESTKELNGQQTQVLALLLGGASIEGAAKTAGLSPATIHRWLNDALFADEYRRGRRQIVEQAATKIQAAATDAAQTMIDIMKNKRSGPMLRLRAAVALYNSCVKWVELEDIQSRLEALEQAQGEAVRFDERLKRLERLEARHMRVPRLPFAEGLEETASEWTAREEAECIRVLLMLHAYTDQRPYEWHGMGLGERFGLELSTLLAYRASTETARLALWFVEALLARLDEVDPRYALFNVYVAWAAEMVRWRKEQAWDAATRSYIEVATVTKPVDARLADGIGEQTEWLSNTMIEVYFAMMDPEERAYLASLSDAALERLMHDEGAEP